MNFLDQILVEKKKEIEEKKFRFPLSMPEPKPLVDGYGRFRSSIGGTGISIIAEIKRQSPSRGLIREDFNPAAIASLYASNGADAVSVLTDGRFFGGSADIFKSVRQTVRLPLLRKDFIIDDYQLIESVHLKADAVLLIVRILDPATLKRFIRQAKELGMDALVEVHSESELEKALCAGAEIVGVNNRDLETFHVDLTASLRLRERIPDSIISVSESGIQSREDVLQLRDAGFNAVLVGESLMREQDIGSALRRLRGNRHESG